MLKPFAIIFFVLVMVWMGAIFVTTNPYSRIDRSCVPITLLDKVVVAVTQLLHEPWAADAHQMMLRFEYGCKFTVWKTFYEDTNAAAPAGASPAPAPEAAKPATSGSGANSSKSEGKTKPPVQAARVEKTSDNTAAVPTQATESTSQGESKAAEKTKTLPSYLGSP